MARTRRDREATSHSAGAVRLNLALDARPDSPTRPQTSPSGARGACIDKMPKHLRYTALENCQAARVILAERKTPRTWRSTPQVARASRRLTGVTSRLNLIRSSSLAG